jgi:hypothetical protein
MPKLPHFDIWYGTKNHVISSDFNQTYTKSLPSYVDWFIFNTKFI